MYAGDHNGTLAITYNLMGVHAIGRKKNYSKIRASFTKKGGRVVPYDPDRNRDTDCCEYYQGNLTRKRSRPIDLQPFTDCHQVAIVMVVHALRKSIIEIKLCPATVSKNQSEGLAVGRVFRYGSIWPTANPCECPIHARGFMEKPS